MRTPPAHAVFTSLLFIFVAILFILTLELGQVARLVPIWIVLLTLGLLACQILLDFLHWFTPKSVGLEKTDFFGIDELRKKTRRNQTSMSIETLKISRELNVFFWLIMLLAFIYVLGFIIAVPIYIFLYLKVRSSEGWFISVAMTIFMFGFIYGVFIIILRVNLYEGFLTGLI